MSLTARAAPLRLVLAEFASATGVSFLLEPGIERGFARTVTIALNGETVETALRRLLNEDNLVLVYSTSGLIEVRVYRAASDADVSTRALTLPADPAAARRAQATSAHVQQSSGNPDEIRPELLERVREWSATVEEERAAREAEGAAIRSALAALKTEGDERKLEKALATLQDGEALPVEPLLDFAAGVDRHPDLRSQAMQVLADQGKNDARVIALLRTLALDGDEDVRETARILLKEDERR